MNFNMQWPVGNSGNLQKMPFDSFNRVLLQRQILKRQILRQMFVRNLLIFSLLLLLTHLSNLKYISNKCFQDKM